MAESTKKPRTSADLKMKLFVEHKEDGNDDDDDDECQRSTRRSNHN
jgi:hypothetical protein